MAFQPTSMVKTLPWQPRLLDSAANQPQFNEDEATKALNDQIKKLGADYNTRLAQVGPAPQRSDFPDQVAYASTFNAWAARKQQLDAAFDVARQNVVQAHNQKLLAAKRPPVIPAWKPQQGPLPQAQPLSVGDVRALPSVGAQVEAFRRKMTGKPTP